jgi:microcystin-dependent protein
MSQSDQVIQNNTGSNVRADINNNLAALYSLSSGSSAPSTTTAHQLWLDTSTTPDTLKIRNASDNGWISLGTAETNFGLADLAGATFTGNVLIPGGTVGAPGLGFAGDSDTGLYYRSGNDLGITTGGTLRAHINTNGFTIRDGLGLRLRDSGNSNYIELKAPALTSDVVLTLPSSDGDAGDMLQTNGSGVLTWEPVQGVPTGTVFCVAYATIPSGYLECNGAAVSRTTYSTLFSKIGVLWGNGDGSSTFELPDLRGEFVRGLDQSRGVDVGRSPWSNQSDSNKQHNHSFSGTSASTGAHTHWVMYNAGQNQGGLRDHAGDPYAATAQSYNTGNDPRQDAEIGARSGSSANAGQSSSTGSHSHTISGSIGNEGSESRPRNVAMIYIIKT